MLQSLAMNPYAAYLGERDPVVTAGETPGILASLSKKLGQEGCERAPAPGKWCAREILCHLADTEVAFAFRLRQALAEPHHVIQPFDQERWAMNYNAYEAEAALGLFTAARNWNLKLMASLPADAFRRPLLHPERGEMTFRTLVETMAGHDLNHIRQIEAIAELAAGAQA